MKKAVFVLGTFEVDAVAKSRALTRRSEELLAGLAAAHGLDLEVSFAIQDEFLAGRNKQEIGIDVIREDRPRVVQEINDAAPDIVMCFGPVASACVFNHGSLTEDGLFRREHRPFAVAPLLPDIDPGSQGPPVFVTYSLENTWRSPGLRQWLALDLEAAVRGHMETVWGDYVTILPDLWYPKPHQLDTKWERHERAAQNIGKPNAALFDAVYYEPPTVVSLDTETYPGLQYYHPEARLRMAQITDKGGRAWVIQADDSKLPGWVKELAEDPNVLKIGSNIKYDYKWLRRFGIVMRNFEDTSIREHIIDQSNPKTGLKHLSLKYWPEGNDYSRGHYDLIAQRVREYNKGRPKSERITKNEGWKLVRDDEQYTYAAGDADASIRTWEGQKEALLELEKPLRISRVLNEVFADIEFQGLRVDMKMNRELDEGYKKYLRELRAEITPELGPINLNSPIQLARALLAAVPDINLRPATIARALDNPDEESEISTAVDVLEREKHKHPIIEKVMTYRRYYKRHSTYVEQMVYKHVVEHHGHHFIHPDFKLSGTETYRPSSSEPNMLNIPRTDDKRPDLSIKRQFCSRWEGGQIVDSDLAQIELRFAAWLSQDRVMLDAIEKDEDLHRITAGALVGRRPEDITDAERQKYKDCTLGIPYGMGARKLAETLQVSKSRASQMISGYWNTYEGLRRFVGTTHVRARRDLMVETVFGFRRHFLEPPHWRHRDAWAILRQAFNTKVQNPSFWLMACGLMWLHAEMSRLDMKSKIVLQVYDSIVIDAHPDEVEKVKELAKFGMEVASVQEAKQYGVDFTVPLCADIKVGDNWGETE